MFRYILFAVLVLCLARPCQAQLTLKGTVQDSLERPIPNVNIGQTYQFFSIPSSRLGRPKVNLRFKAELWDENKVFLWPAGAELLLNSRKIILN